MASLRVPSCFVLCVLGLALSAGSVSAQATRTWVSGVGDDANPCSRTAPCKTFAGAISKTAANGVISVLDPGGFGAVTITKSITIEGDGVVAGILAAGTNGIIVNAGSTDQVTLRNLLIEGAGTGLNGIRYLAGRFLSIENCNIERFTQKGIDVQNSGIGQLTVRNTTIRNHNAGLGGAVLLKPAVGGTLDASFENVQFERSVFGLRVEDNATATVHNSGAIRNSGAGFQVVATSAAAKLTVVDSLVAFNQDSGVRSEGSLATARIGGNTITGNATGLKPLTSGQIISWGHNNLAGNTVDGAPTSTIGQQ